ncbi:MAG TPA: Crp/Fnr family transcriptional regulator [Flavobacterium sp.]|nr:Crp/Fnr family transcriptional regulator [Flavobacterium sp.]
MKIETKYIRNLFETNNLFEKRKTLSRNEYLKPGGTIDTNIYLIEEGSLKISVYKDSEEQIIRFGYKDNFIVALDSFLTEQPSEFYIQAIKKTSVRIIPKKNIIAFLSQDTQHLKIWIALLEDLIVQQIEREKDLLTSSPKERYERVLQRSPQLFQQIPNKHIANYLRMTPETLSRLKKY